MALNELKLVLSVDGAGKVTGNLKDVEGAVESLGKKTTSATSMMAEAWKMLSGALAGLALGAVVKDAINAALQMERLNRQFEVFAGSASLAARELAFVRNEANRLGMDALSLTTQYGQFINAIKGTVNEGQRGRQAFIGLSEGMAAIGMNAEMQGRAWAQLNQGIMKGKFEMEDLKSINEAGLPIFKLMADALGKDVDVILKMQSEGKLLAADVLPKLGESMHQAFGQAAVNSAESAQGAINRMNNALFEAKSAMGAALIPAFTDATKAMIPAIDLLKEFIGGLQILAIKAAAIPDRLGAIWKVISSGKGLFSKDGSAMWDNLTKPIDANVEDTIDDLMKRYTPQGSDYAAAELARQALNKSGQMPSTGSAKWASTYAQLRKEIAALNPIISEHDKKLLDVSAKYAELERKKGANINKLRELKAQHLQAVETAYQTAEAIKATSNEFKEYLRIAGDESKWSEISQNIDDQHKQFRDSIEIMDPAAKAAKQVADAVYDIGRAFDDADQSGAIDAFINDLFKLKDVLSSTTDINISMADSDPAAQQMAVIEERYRREAELIQQRLDALAAANLTETAMYQALSDNILAMATKREQDVANIQRQQSEAGWQGVVGAAQKAFPKLTGLDKAVAAAFKDHTKFRLATEQERAKGAEKLVKDETRSNLSMYSSYAGAAGAVFEGLAATQDTTSRAGFESAKAFNIAAAVMNTAMAITNALATVQPYPAAVAAAAMAGVMGAIQIATIASTTFGGTAAAAPSLPAGSFGGSGGLSSSSIGSLRMGAVEYGVDSLSAESVAGLAAAAENASMAVGDLAGAFVRATAAFKEGGAGYDAIDMMIGLRSGQIKTTAANYGSDPTMLAAMNAILASYYKTIEMAAAGLGTSVAGGKQFYTYADAGGVSRQDVLEYYRIDVGEMVSTYAMGMQGLVDYAKPGELAADAAERLYTALYEVNTEFDKLGLKLLEGLQGADIASALTESFAAKGQDFSEALESYATGLFSEEEQTAMELAAAKREFERGMQFVNGTVYNFARSTDIFTGETKDFLTFYKAQVPKTRDEFKALANDLAAQLDDANAEVRRNAASSLAGLLSLSEAFGTMMQAADEAAEKLKKLAEAQKALDEDVLLRTLRINGLTAQASLLELQYNQERELAEARDQGLDVTKLLTVQAAEYAKEAGKAATAFSEAQQKLVDAQKKAVLDSITATTTVLQALKKMLTGSSVFTSPQEAYRQAKQSLADADLSNVVERGNTLLAASQRIAGSAAAYQADYALVTATLARFAETEPQLSAVERQIDLLAEIRDAINNGNTNTVRALQITFSDAGITAENAENSLRLAFQSIQDLLNGGLIDPLQAQTAIQNASKIVQYTLNGAISGSAAAQALATQSFIAQAALNGTISGTQAADAINTQADTVQSALDGAITAQDAERRIKEQYDIVSDVLATGAASSLKSVSSALSTFSISILDAAIATQNALNAFTGSLQIQNKQAAAAAIAEAEMQKISLSDKAAQDYFKSIVWAEIINGITYAATNTPLPGYPLDIWKQLSIAEGKSKYSDYTADIFKIPGISSFDVGTSYVPYDMLANIHQGEMVIDPQSSAVLRKYGIRATGAADNKEMVAELKALRSETNMLRAELRAVVRNTADTSKQLSRWDGDGMPEVRSIAA